MTRNLIWIVGVIAAGISLSWLAMPRVTACGENPTRVMCASNLKQIGQALLIYANENQGAFAPDFATLLVTTDLMGEAFVCSNSGDKPTHDRELKRVRVQFASRGHNSYAYAPPPTKWSELDPNDAIAFERNSHYANDAGMNVLFGDGHVEYLAGEPVFSILDQCAKGTRPNHLSLPPTSTPIAPAKPATSPAIQTEQAHD